MVEQPRVICSFYDKCEACGKHCWHCSFNGSLRIDNYLVLKDKDGRTVKYLESNSG